MTKKTLNKTEAAILRQKAEAYLEKNASKTGSQNPDADVLKLIHELDVYQVELELLNEELRLAKEKVDLVAEKYTSLYDFAPSGYFTLSKEGTISEVNLRGAMMLGKERSNLMNTSFGFFVSDSTKPIFLQFLDKVFSSFESHSCILLLAIHSGITRQVHFTGIASENGKQCLATMDEIPELKQAETALLDSENFNRLLFEQSTIGLALMEMDGKLVDANPAYTKIIGRTIEESLQLTYWDITPEEYYEQEYKQLKTLSLTGTYGPYEKEYIHKDGHRVPVRLQGKIVERNGINYIWSSVEDITDCKNAKETLKESEARIKSIFRSAPVGIGVVSNRILMEVNERMCEITGYSANELVGQNSRMIYPSDEEFESVGKYKYEQIKKYGTGMIETSFLRKDGKLIDIILSSTPIDPDDLSIGVTFTVLEITGRKKAEKEIKFKNEQLLNLNAQKDKFFSIIAHDLRGPFSGFLGLTKIIAEELSTTDTEAIQQMGEAMRRSASNIFKLLENLLQWSQMEQGLIPFTPAWVPLHSFFVESFSTELQTAKNKKIEVEFDIPDNISVYADEKMLRSIISNLFSNATKFTPIGGKINISAIFSVANAVEISIQDNGIGMSKDIQNKLFRLAEQVNRKGTEGELSTGLGLFLCKDFIEKHSGELQVESEEGKGSTFRFTIPGQTEAEPTINIPAATRVDNSPEQHGMHTLLIAEDDEASELLLSTTLSSISKKIFKAKTGPEAIKVCHDNPDIDLVLMDIQIPEINGYEVTLQIRQFNKEVVIIAQTAYGMPGEQEKAIDAGCNDYIAKPLDIGLLKGLIQKHFKNKTA